jgi:hypothetical protein
VCSVLCKKCLILNSNRCRCNTAKFAIEGHREILEMTDRCFDDVKGGQANSSSSDERIIPKLISSEVPSHLSVSFSPLLCVLGAPASTLAAPQTPPPIISNPCFTIVRMLIASSPSSSDSLSSPHRNPSHVHGLERHSPPTAAIAQHRT